MSFSKANLIQMANTIRVLSLDMIQKAQSGHPGAVLGMADMITVLFAKHLNFDTKNPTSDLRDRFILSAGHASAMLYSVLHLCGYKITLNDLKQFRQLHSITQGHPEINQNIGIELSTGPLGQGFAMSTGIALALKKKQAINKKYDKTKVYVFVSDGDLMEGISSEAISFAGHYNLNNLIVLWDNNGITIDGKTDISISDNICQKFKASNWNVLNINGNNIKEIDEAINTAKKSSNPTFIACKTTIGLYSKNSGQSKVHGSPLDIEDYMQIRKKLGYEKYKPFYIPNSIKKLWESISKKLEKIQPLKIKNIDKNCNEAIKYFVSDNKLMATRNSNKQILNYLMKDNNHILIGGSADLSGNVGTVSNYSIDINKQDYSGNYIHYGIREHLMGAIMNGLTISGFRTFGGTFLSFSDYMKPAIRLSALMKQPVIYIFTHDSIAVGEDGATHQPIEQISSFRLMPNINVFRPCDGVELTEAWNIALTNKDTPSIFSLTRQNLPLLRTKTSKMNQTSLGGYILSEAHNGYNDRKITLIATGSEVCLAMEVQKILTQKNLETAVVSMPCCELFDKQSEKYKSKILKTDKSLIVAIEMGSSQFWYKYADEVIGIDKFGTSGKYEDVLKEYGFTSNNIANKIINIIKKYFK